MPETAKEYGVRNIYDARDNIEGGVKYLKDLIKLNRGKTNLVLAAYNAGQEAIKKYGGIPPYPETRNYIKKVMAAYSNSTIRTRSKIYEFYDDSGKVVLTNTPYYFSIRKSQPD
jgi:soluble lytic murein transglycosylase-like protein